MSWQAVARKDFQDAVRSRWLLGLTAAFVLLVSGIVYVVRPAPGEALGSSALLNSVFVEDALVTTLIPLIALVIAYNSVVGERESGSLKLLLSLPNSRADVVAGKVIGRTGALAAPIAVGFLLPAFVFALGPLEFEPVTYVGYTLFVILLGAVFVSIAVGFSAASRSQRLAIAGAIVIYFVFVPLWGAIQFPLQLYLLGGGPPGWVPLNGGELFRAIRLFNPTGAFKLLTTAFLNGELFAATPPQGIPPRNLQLSALSMLLVWLLSPPLLGLWRLDREDL